MERTGTRFQGVSKHYYIPKGTFEKQMLREDRLLFLNEYTYKSFILFLNGNPS